MSTILIFEHMVWKTKKNNTKINKNAVGSFVFLTYMLVANFTYMNFTDVYKKSSIPESLVTICLTPLEVISPAVKLCRDCVKFSSLGERKRPS